MLKRLIYISFAFNLSLASVYALCATHTGEITLGVEPFAAPSVIAKLINNEINETLIQGGHNPVTYIPSNDIKEFKSQASNNTFTLFYGHPGYAHYLANLHGYIPIIALKTNSPAIVISNKNKLPNFNKKTLAYTLEDHDIYTYLGKKEIKDKAKVVFIHSRNVELIISGVFSTPHSIGIISETDLTLMIPQARSRIKIIGQSRPVKYSFIMAKPKKLENIKQLTQIFFKAHSVLSNDKNSYFYGASPESINSSHIQYLNQYSVFQKIFDHNL